MLYFFFPDSFAYFKIASIDFCEGDKGLPFNSSNCFLERLSVATSFFKSASSFNALSIANFNIGEASPYR